MGEGRSIRLLGARQGQWWLLIISPRPVARKFLGPSCCEKKRMIGYIADFFSGGKRNGCSGDFPWFGRAGGVFSAPPGKLSGKSMDRRRGQAALSGAGVAGGGAVILLMNVSSVLEKPLIIDMITAAK